MKKLLMLVCIAGLACLSGCAAKIPVPVDQEKGIVVIPMKVRNDTPLPCPYDYELHSSVVGEQAVIIVHPTSGQEYYVSQELKSGFYSIGVGERVFSITSDVRTSGSNRYRFTIGQNIEFTIHPGTITVADKILDIHSKVTGPESYGTWFEINSIDNSKQQEIVDELKASDNTQMWKYVLE